MPGPLIRPRKSPMLDALPEGVQSVLETLFPTGDVVGPAMPQTAILGPAGAAGKSLVETLGPLLKGGLQRGLDVAPEIMQKLRDFLPLPPVSTLQRNGTGARYMQNHPEAREVYSMLRDFAQNPTIAAEQSKDPLKVLALERINMRPPAQSYVKLPTKDLEFSASLRTRPIERDPLIEQLYDRYKAVDALDQPAKEAIFDLPPVSSLGGKPELSGRWHNRMNSNASGQGHSLYKIYSKKPVQ